MKKPELREAWCDVLDAIYKEDLGTEENQKFSNGVFLQLKELETGMIFTSYLTTEEVQDISGSKEPLSSMDLIRFAAKLRSRTDPLRMLAPVNSRLIKASMIKASEKLEKNNETKKQIKDEIIDLELEKPLIKKKISKVSIKDKLEQSKGES